MDFFACYFGKSGLFCVLLGRKWTILRAFLGESGLFARFWGESGPFWPKLWTILDTFGPWGDAFTPLAPPLAMGLTILFRYRAINIRKFSFFYLM